MTREQAIETAKVNHITRMKADVARLLNRGPDFDDFAEYGYKHGWYFIGGHSISLEEVTGEVYDSNQGGWAHI